MPSLVPEVLTAHPIVDAVLGRHRDALPVYRNHVLRGLNYQGLLLGRPAPDPAALARAVHDPGIWTAGTFDYLALAADHAAACGVTDLDGVRLIRRGGAHALRHPTRPLPMPRW
jgi:hypothetical protein